MENAISTNMAIKEQRKAAGTALGLGDAFKGLWLSVKKATVAMLEFLFTTPAGWATLAVSAIAGVVIGVKQYRENITKAAEESKNAIDEITDSYKSLRSTVDDIKMRYAGLSQGVNQFTGENISLDNGEYAEFLSLSNQLAELFPSLTKRYDENGNAILNLSGSADLIVQSLTELAETEKRLSSQKILGEFPDLLKGYSQNRSDMERKLRDLEGWQQRLRTAYQSLRDADQVNGNVFMNDDHEFRQSTYVLETLNIEFQAAEDKERYRGWTIELEDYDASLNKIRKALETAKTDISNIHSQIKTENMEFNKYLSTWLFNDWSYVSLDPEMKNVVQEMLFNSDWLTDAKSQGVNTKNWDDVSKWLEANYITAIASIDDSNIQAALLRLYSVPAGEQPIGEFIEQYKKSFKDIIEYNRQNDLRIPISISSLSENGFLDAYGRLQDSIRRIADDHGIVDRDEYSYLIDKTKDLTFAQIGLWLEATRGAENAAQADEMWDKVLQEIAKGSHLIDVDKYKDQIDGIQSAISTLRSALESVSSGKMTQNDLLDLVQQFPELMPYIDLTAEGFGNLSEGLRTLISLQPEPLTAELEALKSSLATDEERSYVDLLISSLQRLGESENSLASYGQSLDQFQSSVKSASDAYATLLTGSYSSSELLDSIQAISKAASDMGASVNWESIAASADPLQALRDKIEAVSQAYAGNVLSGAGISADSEFGQMLANIIQEAYKSEAALSSLNTQVNSLQDAYSSLADIAETYNSTGHITFSQLQALLAMEPQYISCLTDEGGQLELDREALEELAKQRLADARAQAVQQAITELNGLAHRKEAGGIRDAQAALTDSMGTLSAYEERLAGAMGTVSLASGEFAGLSEAIGGAAEGGASQEDIDEIIRNMKNKLKLIDETAGSFPGMDEMLGGTAASASAYTETIDFFDRRIKNLGTSLTLLKTAMENATAPAAKNALADAQLDIMEEKLRNYSDALAMYSQKAGDALSRLPAGLAGMAKNGAVALTEFTGDTSKAMAEAVRDYQAWADKISSCRQEMEALRKETRQLELGKFNTLMEGFDSQASVRESAIDLISRQIALLREAGQPIGEAYYAAQAEQAARQLALLETEKAQLEAQMSSSLASGRIQEGTEEWRQMADALSGVDAGILDCRKSLAGFEGSIRSLRTEAFDSAQERLSRLASEISSTLNLMDGLETSDENGVWTKEGITRMGLLAQQHELARHQAREYGEEIKRLEGQYLAGSYPAAEYADRLAELSSAQRDAAKAAGDAKDAILELNEARVENAISAIEKETDAYSGLVQAQIQALKASRDLHSHESAMEGKTKAVTALERQLAAMQADTTAAAAAKRRKLEEQLAEAKQELEEAEYEHADQAQEDALSRQLEAYKAEREKETEALRESLGDKEAVLAAAFGTVRSNAALVGQEITALAASHGITASEALTAPWREGENAIAGYGTALGQGTSAFIASIMEAENEAWALQAQADMAADSLAWMFSAKADALVGELEALNTAGTDLVEVTDTLRQNLAETLRLGYEINTIELPESNGKKDTEEPEGNQGQGGQQGRKIPSKGTGGNSRMFFADLKVDIPHYAGGTRATKGILSVTDEQGPELKLPRLASGKYTIASEGTQILDSGQTDNMFGWSKINPEDFIASLRTQPGAADGQASLAALNPVLAPLPFGTVLEHLGRSMEPAAAVVNRTVNSNPVHIGNLINVQGSVDSSNIRQMEKIADKAVDRLVNRLHDGLVYGC